MTERYSGVLTELGGPELGASGNEKPRKVIVKADVAKQYGKTFRVWAGTDLWRELEGLHGKPVTIEFETEQRQGPKGPYPQNMIVGVTSNNGEGGGGDWSVPSPSDSRVWGSARGDESETTPQSPPAPSKEEYWERRERKDEARSLEMEAAWALKAVLDLEGPDHGLSDDELLTHALQLIFLKRRIAMEMSK